MKLRISAAVLLLVLAALLWVRGSRQAEGAGNEGDGGASPGRDAAAVSQERSGNAAGLDSKSSGRRSLREMLPAGTEIEADEMRESSAKGNVRIKLSDGVECWADRISAGTEKDIYVVEGRVLIWTEEGRSCIIHKGGPLKLKLGEDEKRLVTVSNGSGSSMQMERFDEPQSEEQMLALRDSLKEGE